MPTLRELRRDRKWTQKDLAERLGVTSNTVARWERGEVTPSRFVVRAIAQLFGVKVVEIDVSSRSSQSEPTDADAAGRAPD
jgi:transcriptional regulator with XRE-family HTH domain